MRRHFCLCQHKSLFPSGLTYTSCVDTLSHDTWNLFYLQIWPISLTVMMLRVFISYFLNYLKSNKLEMLEEVPFWKVQHVIWNEYRAVWIWRLVKCVSLKRVLRLYGCCLLNVNVFIRISVSPAATYCLWWAVNKYLFIL